MKSVRYGITPKALLIGIMICAVVGVIVSPNTVSANSLPISWVMTAGGDDADEAKAVTIDGAGHSYVAGEFFGSGDFDSGPGTTTLTSAGQNDIFIARYDSVGSLAWAKSVGGSNFD